MFTPLEGKPESNNPRDYYKRFGDTFVIPFADIDKVILAPDAKEGIAADLFCRDVDPAHAARIAQSIRANGFLKDKEPTFWFEKGRLTVAKGNHRVAALQLLKREGYGDGEDDLKEVRFKVEDRRKTKEDAEDEVWLDNDGLALTMEKKAELVYRKFRRNNSIKTIAEKLAISESYASKLLDFHTMPDELKAIAKSGDIAGTEVLKTYQKHDRDLGDTKAVIEAAVEDAKGKGKARATGKNIKAVEERVAPKRQKAFDVKPVPPPVAGEIDSPMMALVAAALAAARKLREVDGGDHLAHLIDQNVEHCIKAGLLPKSVLR